MVDLAASVWRDFVTDGVPASGANKPQKSKIRAWGAYVERQQAGSGLDFVFSATTADADPGAGTFRMNNAAVASVTALYIDNVDALGTAVSAIIDSWDDSTNPVRGILNVRGITNDTVLHVFRVTGTVVDGGGYRKVTVSYIGGSGAFVAADDYLLTFSRSGEPGAVSTVVGGSGISVNSTDPANPIVSSSRDVATRAAMKALNTTKDTACFLTESGREGTFLWRTGDFSALITADTQEGIYLKANAIASTVGAWVRQNAGKWNATWFGMDSAATGAANVTAFTAACNLAKGLLGVVHIPAALSKYVMASLVTITMANNEKLHITGDGYASSAMAWPGTNGLQIDMIAGPWWIMSVAAPGNAVTFDGIGFLTDGNGVANTAAGAALVINGNNTGGRPPSATIIKNCKFSSTVGSSCWAIGIKLSSVSSVVIDKTFWYGCSNVRNIGNFINLTATLGHDASPYHITNCEAYFFGSAILAGPYIEGLHIESTDLTIGDYGVVWDGSASGGESQLCMVGCQINTTVRGVWLTNVQHSQISDSLIFISGASGTAIDLVDASSSTIEGNVIDCESLATTSGIVFRASVFTTANYLTRASAVSGNAIHNATTGLNLGTNVRNIRVGQNGFVGCTTDMADTDLANGLVKFSATDVSPNANGGVALGTGANSWANLCLASGAQINFGNTNAAILHNAGAVIVTFGGTGAVVTTATALRPFANDGVALGAGAIAWSDLFLASGGVLNFNNGNYTVTHTAGNLSFNGSADFTGAVLPTVSGTPSLGSGTKMWNSLFLMSGGVINFANGDATLTHGTGKRLSLAGNFGRGAPVLKSADFTVADTENWLVNNKAAATCTVTLPAAASYTGREITINNYQAFTVVSASSNVVPLVGGAAGTAILAATAGKWITLVSDGANWRAMQGN